ncbi:class I SAM-dependent methyltransferase [Prevotella sp. KH2C16]|uniref:class I SAM-dependent methyltransferase n=1 Tax=Prevotella sp. KH2C16 TaxID=1855325 RepID=UPI0008DEF9DF|nr:class I SAM-dependent methyltransferase [Prevotella sp. KH2C16]SFG43369.1 Methyltransferase domain-containing protein [Prevotella sp. KH2C16]
MTESIIHKNNRYEPEYGNWIPVKLVGILLSITLVFFVVFGLTMLYSESTLLKVLTTLLFLAAVFIFGYMIYVRRAFDFRHGGLMGKIHQYVLDHLAWDGKGRLLDVGCGSGALTIRCAKAFAEAECTGIDYWGAMWDYNQKMCERNAEIEGVSDRCSFRKDDANRLEFRDETFDAVVSNFVYHEVHNNPDKEALIRETLRVLKKGGAFALHDLFSNKQIYKDFDTIINHLKADGISELHFVPNTEKTLPMPQLTQMPGMLTGLGMIYGKK